MGPQNDQGYAEYLNRGTPPAALPSRLPSSHTPWSGLGSWCPGGARHCTNDLDTRNQARSALPGMMADGMAATYPHPIRTAPADGAPAIPESEAPAGGTSLNRTAHLTLTTTSSHLPAALGAPSLDLLLSYGRLRGCSARPDGGQLRPGCWMGPAVALAGGVSARSGAAFGGTKRLADHPVATVVARGRGRGGAGRRQERRPSPRARAGPRGGPVGCDS